MDETQSVSMALSRALESKSYSKLFSPLVKFTKVALNPITAKEDKFKRPWTNP